MTDHSVEAVVERGAQWFHKFMDMPNWPTPEQEDECRQACADFLAAIFTSGDHLPGGLVVVPMKATVEMSAAGREKGHPNDRFAAGIVWRAMIEASHD